MKQLNVYNIVKKMAILNSVSTNRKCSGEMYSILKTIDLHPKTVEQVQNVYYSGKFSLPKRMFN